MILKHTQHEVVVLLVGSLAQLGERRVWKKDRPADPCFRARLGSQNVLLSALEVNALFFFFLRIPYTTVFDLYGCEKCIFTFFKFSSFFFQNSIIFEM